MFNIQKAVSRLDYAPKLKEIEITDIKRGLGMFTPQPDKQVSFAALKTALKKAGYTLASAEITVAGILKRDGEEWSLVVESSGQRFALGGVELDRLLATTQADSRIEVTGDWKTAGAGAGAREVISPSAVKPQADVTEKAARLDTSPPSGFSFTAARFDTSSSVIDASSSVIDASSSSPFNGSHAEPPASPLSPIRATSPGLTVYKGGVVAPRLYLVKQHLDNLEVHRQTLQMSVSYTPSPRLQLEAEVPFSRISYDDGAREGAGFGLGNITLWGKYRFYRTVKTYGDRQAALRFGLELPTGQSDAPGADKVSAPAFVRQQLTPINGGLSPHVDVSFSQAGGRFIFGGNLEAVLRRERDGFRLGHEVRVNTDLEYVLLPRDYERPGNELFVILETNLIRRWTGRLDNAPMPGSSSTEYYIAPGLQYAAHPQFVVEASMQLPLVRNTGSVVLRNDRNILLGVKYLF